MEMFRTPVQSPCPPPLVAASCAVTAKGTLYRICTVHTKAVSAANPCGNMPWRWVKS